MDVLGLCVDKACVSIYVCVRFHACVYICVYVCVSHHNNDGKVGPYQSIAAATGPRQQSVSVQHRVAHGT